MSGRVRPDAVWRIGPRRPPPNGAGSCGGPSGGLFVVRLCVLRTSSPPSSTLRSSGTSSGSPRRPTRQACCLPCLLGGRQADLDQVERADEAVGDAEPTGAGDRVAKRHRPVMLEQDQRGRRVVRDLLQDVPRLVVGEDVDPLLGRCLGSRDRPCFGPLLTLDAEADQRADDGADLDCLVLGQVAQMLHLDLTVRVLVHGERVDHPHRPALAQTLQLLDDLAVEVRALETQHDQLHRSDCHVSTPFGRSGGGDHARCTARPYPGAVVAVSSQRHDRCHRLYGLWRSSAASTSYPSASPSLCAPDTAPSPPASGITATKVPTSSSTVTPAASASSTTWM